MHFMLVLAFYYCGTFFCVITPSTFLSMSQVSLSQQGYLQLFIYISSSPFAVNFIRVRQAEKKQIRISCY